MRYATLRVVPVMAGCLLFALAACSRKAPSVEPAPAAGPADAAATRPADTGSSAAAFTWPASLHPFGEGYPNPGDPCRRVGESPAVADFLDHTQVLVGCPGRADETAAATLLAEGQGKALAYIDGVTIIAVPPNAAM